MRGRSCSDLCRFGVIQCNYFNYNFHFFFVIFQLPYLLLSSSSVKVNGSLAFFFIFQNFGALNYNDFAVVFAKNGTLWEEYI